MQRVYDLQHQIFNISTQFFKVDSVIHDTSIATLPPPTKTMEDALRQLIITGYSDSIAQRIPPGSPLLQGLSRRKRLTGEEYI